MAAVLALVVALFLYLRWERRRGGDWQFRALWRIALAIVLPRLLVGWLA